MENSVSKPIEKAQQFSGYLELKEYQRQTIEAYLSGRDVFVSAQTGYGKSLTFELAPHAFEYLSENNKSLVLVLVPLVSRLWKTKLAIWSVVEFLLAILGTTASQSEVTNMPHMRLDNVAQITLITLQLSPLLIDSQ